MKSPGSQAIVIYMPFWAKKGVGGRALDFKRKEDNSQEDEE